MMTDIETCEAEIAQIDKTLTKIKKELDRGNVESNIEVENLGKNLLELRELTQDKLIELRKNAMLAMIDDVEQTNSNNEADCEVVSDVELVNDALYNCDNSTNDYDLNVDESVLKIINKLNIQPSNLEEQKCSFPYWTSNGIFFYHNAVVHDVDMKSQNASLVVCNPTCLGEVPCDDWLLSDSCKNVYCSLSHGINVPFDNLYEYQIPDFTNLDENSRCLCLLENETIWSQAIIQHVDLPNETCYVFLTDCKFHTPIHVSLSNIFPLNVKLKRDNSSAQNIDDLNTGECDEFDMESYEELSIQLTADNGRPFGEWEKFTRGIGSKIMASMGYVPGRGLGKLEDGRANPVPIEVLPARRSLDKVMQLRNKKLPIASSSNSMNPTSKKKANLFTFMNKHLSKSELTKSASNKNKPRTTIIEAHNLSKKSDKDISVQVYETSNEIARVRSSIVKLQSSLDRHSGPTTAVSIKKRLKEYEDYLEKLITSEVSLLKHQDDRKGTKKLKIF